MEVMDRKTLSYEKEVERNLGQRVRELRKERGLTQEQLAELADLHATYLGLIEIGKKLPSLHSLIKVSKALKVPLFHIFMFEGDMPLKERSLRELMDLLKSGDDEETKFLLSVAREHRKSYG